MALLLALLAAVAIDIGLILLKVRGEAVARRSGPGLGRFLAACATDPLWIAGLSCQPLGYACYLRALELAPLNIVQTAMSAGVVLFVVYGVWFWGERLTRLEWGAVGAVLSGMVLLGVSLTPGGGATEPPLAPGAVLYLSVGLVALSAVVWIGLARHGGPEAEGLALGIASGLLLGLASIYARGLAIVLAQSRPGSLLLAALTSPYAPLTLVANLIGFLLLLAAFRTGRASIVLALSATISNVVPIVAGMLALGEQLPPNRWLATSRLAAIALTLGGAALLVHLTPAIARRGGGWPAEPSSRR
jgi:uncharacterized membrane protein